MPRVTSPPCGVQIFRFGPQGSPYKLMEALKSGKVS